MLQLLIGVSAAAFIYFLALSVINLATGKKEAVKQRLNGIFSTPQEKMNKKGIKSPRKLRRTPNYFGKVREMLASELSCSGIKLREEEFVVLWAALTLIPWSFYLLFRADWLVSLALSISGFILPLFAIRRAKNKRLALFESQLSSALIVMGNCLRSGLSFQQAIDSIVRDMPEPISKEFGRVVREVQFGVSMEKALENMSTRIKSNDLMLLVSAVLIQRQVGGNLSEILQNISDTIRDRLKIKANIRVLTTTGRASSKIVGLIPVFILLILMVINPSYVRSFFETKAGTVMLVIASVLEVVGFLAVRKVSQIKF
jgi:tight adherence protein B